MIKNIKKQNIGDSYKESQESTKTDLGKEMESIDDLNEGGMYGYLDWFYDGQTPGEDE